MTTSEQARFVRELSNTIAKDVIAKLKPLGFTAWDGHELRVLLADHFAASAEMSLIRQHPRSQRARDYRNLKSIHNL